MRKSLLFSFLFVATLINALNFYNYQNGMAESRKTGKPLLLYGYREHCPYCRHMDTYVLSDPEVEEAINNKFIYATIDLDSDEGKKLAERYNMNVSPYFLILEPTGHVLYAFSGSREKERFLKELNLTGNNGKLYP